MQYDGSGLQPGVQFQCTQCGSMVQVAAAPAPMARRAPVRAGGRAAQGGRPMGPPGAQQQGGQQMPYGPPRKSGGGGVIAIVVVAVLVVVVVIGVVVGVSSRSARIDDKEQAEKDRVAAQRERVERENAELQRKEAEMRKPLEASLKVGEDIAGAIRSNNRTMLDSMFDWNKYAEYNKQLAAGDATHMNSALMAEGAWEEIDEEGKTKIKWVGKSIRTSDSLRQRALDYIENFMFGSTGVTWARGKSELVESRFSLAVGGEEYYGHRLFIDVEGAGRTKEFWVGAPRGSTDVKILNFVDKSMMQNVQEKEARSVVTENRDFLREDYDPSKGALGKDGGADSGDPRNDPDHGLPIAVKTGDMPTLATLVNCVTEIRRGNKLNEMRLSQVRDTTVSRKEKKATMGAIIDILIDAHKGKDRTGKYVASLTLWEVWNNSAFKEWNRDKLVYEMRELSTQDETDIIIRRWREIYNGYKVEEGDE
jgi:hypothetical protein